MGAREQAEAAKLSVEQVKKVQVKYPAVHTHIKNINYCITVNCLIVKGAYDTLYCITPNYIVSHCIALFNTGVLYYAVLY